MARIRSVKPEFWTNSTTGRLSGTATKLYLGLHNHSDDYGVVRFEPDELRVKILPYEKTAKAFEQALAELIDAGSDENPHGLVEVFRVSRKRYLWLPFFNKHQRVEKKGDALIEGWTAVSTPLDYADSGNGTGMFPERYGNVPAGEEWRGEEGKGEEGNRSTPLSSSRRTPPAGPIAEIWECYVGYHPRAVYTDRGKNNRRSIIERALAWFPVETCIAAIDGNHLDPHCNGENDRGATYHDLELILRDPTHIEKYAGISGGTNGAGPPRMTQEEANRVAEEAGL